jgi:hypothetical protein
MFKTNLNETLLSGTSPKNGAIWKNRFSFFLKPHPKKVFFLIDMAKTFFGPNFMNIDRKNYFFGILDMHSKNFNFLMNIESKTPKIDFFNLEFF